jgi:hypothetical protein
MSPNAFFSTAEMTTPKAGGLLGKGKLLIFKRSPAF